MRTCEYIMVYGYASHCNVDSRGNMVKPDIMAVIEGSCPTNAESQYTEYKLVHVGKNRLVLCIIMYALSVSLHPFRDPLPPLVYLALEHTSAENVDLDVKFSHLAEDKLLGAVFTEPVLAVLVTQLVCTDP